MEGFLRLTAVVLVGLILMPVIGRQSKDMALLLSLAICVLVCLGAMELLEPVTELLNRLRSLGELDAQGTGLLLKAAGIGILAELAGLLCADAGQNALGKAVQILSNAAILWLSLPLLGRIVELIGEVLAEF